MIANPRAGQRVRLHYAAAKRRFFAYHGRAGDGAGDGDGAGAGAGDGDGAGYG
ncbi:MAG TPA: hypothetical protein VEI97_08320 [bacterium]|nr:hypothetical protein [bacterium]